MTRSMTKAEIKKLDTYAKSHGFKDIYEMDALLLRAGKGSSEVLQWGKNHGDKYDLLAIIREKQKKDSHIGY